MARPRVYEQILEIEGRNQRSGARAGDRRQEQRSEARDRDQELDLEMGAIARYQGQDLEIQLIILVQEQKIDSQDQEIPSKSQRSRARAIDWGQKLEIGSKSSCSRHLALVHAPWLLDLQLLLIISRSCHQSLALAPCPVGDQGQELQIQLIILVQELNIDGKTKRL